MSETLGGNVQNTAKTDVDNFLKDKRLEGKSFKEINEIVRSSQENRDTLKEEIGKDILQKLTSNEGLKIVNGDELSYLNLLLPKGYNIRFNKEADDIWVKESVFIFLDEVDGGLYLQDNGRKKHIGQEQRKHNGKVNIGSIDSWNGGDLVVVKSGDSLGKIAEKQGVGGVEWKDGANDIEVGQRVQIDRESGAIKVDGVVKGVFAAMDHTSIENSVLGTAEEVSAPKLTISHEKIQKPVVGKTADNTKVEEKKDTVEEVSIPVQKESNLNDTELENQGDKPLVSIVDTEAEIAPIVENQEAPLSDTQKVESSEDSVVVENIVDEKQEEDNTENKPVVEITPGPMSYPEGTQENVIDGFLNGTLTTPPEPQICEKGEGLEFDKFIEERVNQKAADGNVVEEPKEDDTSVVENIKPVEKPKEDLQSETNIPKKKGWINKIGDWFSSKKEEDKGTDNNLPEIKSDGVQDVQKLDDQKDEKIVAPVGENIQVEQENSKYGELEKEVDEYNRVDTTVKPSVGDGLKDAFNTPGKPEDATGSKDAFDIPFHPSDAQNATGSKDAFGERRVEPDFEGIPKQEVGKKDKIEAKTDKTKGTDNLWGTPIDSSQTTGSKDAFN